MSPTQLWRVRRVVEELMEVQASNKQEAIENAIDPHRIRVISQTAVRVKDLPQTIPSGEEHKPKT